MAMMTNSNVVLFPSAGDTATHMSLWTAQTGGTFQGSSPLTTTRDTPLRFPVGDLEMEIPAGELSAAGAIAALTPLRSTTLWVQIHSAAPGTSGTSSVIGSRVAVTWAAITS